MFCANGKTELESAEWSSRCRPAPPLQPLNLWKLDTQETEVLKQWQIQGVKTFTALQWKINTVGNNVVEKSHIQVVS